MKINVGVTQEDIDKDDAEIEDYTACQLAVCRAFGFMPRLVNANHICFVLSENTELFIYLGGHKCFYNFISLGRREPFDCVLEIPECLAGIVKQAQGEA